MPTYPHNGRSSLDLETGDLVHAREPMIGFLWPRVTTGALGMVTAVGPTRLRVHFLSARRSVWVDAEQVAPTAGSGAATFAARCAQSTTDRRRSRSRTGRGAATGRDVTR